MTQPLIEHEFRGKKLSFTDTPQAPDLIREIFSDNYKVLEAGIEFKDGDVVLDIGACEGMFSTMMSVLFPHIRIIALEPVPRTYGFLVDNLTRNGCKNVEAYNIGVGKTGAKTGIINMGLHNHSGGSSSWLTFDPTKTEKVEVGLISLDDAFELYGIDRCRFLKIDIEGAEYDALYSCTVLPRVDYMAGEFHMNQRLTFETRRMDALATWCHNQTKLIYIECCNMAE